MKRNGESWVPENCFFFSSRQLGSHSPLSLSRSRARVPSPTIFSNATPLPFRRRCSSRLVSLTIADHLLQRNEVSSFVHACEGDAVTKLTNEKIPYFNAQIYLENKTQIGKVDEIFGPINESFFSVKMMEGIVATSYAAGDKFYIDPMKLLPLARFLSVVEVPREVVEAAAFVVVVVGSVGAEGDI